MNIFSPIQIVEIQSFGINGSGTFSMPGVKAGDLLISVEHITPSKPEPVGMNATSGYKPSVDDDDVMAQVTGSAYADNEFIFRFLRLNQQS